MNCYSFEEILTELTRNNPPDQILEANLREGALAHLNECSACAKRLQDGRALTNRLDEMAREMKSFTAPASLEEALRKTFRSSFSPPGSLPVRSIERPMNRFGRWNRWAVAAAAVVLIVLAIGGLLLRAGRQLQPEPVRTQTAATSIPPRELPVPIEGGTSGSPPKPDREVTVTVSRKSPYRRIPRPFGRRGLTSPQTTVTAPPAISNDYEGEVATQFMTLGYADPISLQDGGQLVRVELPRSAMLSMGLPVNMDRYSERVKADVLLGADGLARAIRFVQ